VAGHYLPLADNPGIAPRPDQTRSLQSDQRTLNEAPRLRCRLCRRPRHPPRGLCQRPGKAGSAAVLDGPRSLFSYSV